MNSFFGIGGKKQPEEQVNVDFKKEQQQVGDNTEKNVLEKEDVLENVKNEKEKVKTSRDQSSSSSHAVVPATQVRERSGTVTERLLQSFKKEPKEAIDQIDVIILKIMEKKEFKDIPYKIDAIKKQHSECLNSIKRDLEKTTPNPQGAKKVFDDFVKDISDKYGIEEKFIRKNLEATSKLVAEGPEMLERQRARKSAADIENAINAGDMKQFGLVLGGGDLKGIYGVENLPRHLQLEVIEQAQSRIQPKLDELKEKSNKENISYIEQSKAIKEKTNKIAELKGEMSKLTNKSDKGYTTRAALIETLQGELEEQQGELAIRKNSKETNKAEYEKFAKMNVALMQRKAL